MKYEIGNRIRKYREERGLSQRQLAEMIGVSNSKISNWEQGINRPDADILANICIALNISPSELLDVHLSEEQLHRTRERINKSIQGQARTTNGCGYTPRDK